MKKAFAFSGGPWHGQTRTIQVAGPGLPPPPWLHVPGAANDQDNVAVYGRQQRTARPGAAPAYHYVLEPPTDAANVPD